MSTEATAAVALPRLWLIADRALVPDGALDRAIASMAPVLKASAIRVGLIERDHTGGPDAARVARIEALIARLRPLGVPVWVNRRADLAVRAGADGVQLTSFDPHAAAPWPALPFARSCHAGDPVAAILASGARFILLAPVRDPLSKARSRPPLGLDGFEAIARHAPGQVVALGGIRPEDVGPLLARGAAGVATVGSVFGAPDAGAALGAFIAAFEALEPSPEGEEAPDGLRGRGRDGGSS